MRVLAFTRKVVIEQRSSPNARRSANDVVIPPLEARIFSDDGAEFFKKQYPDETFDLTPSKIAAAVGRALEIMETTSHG